MLYAGTHVAAGRARAVVVATGLATEIGRIAELAESAPGPLTPLERRIDQFGRRLIGVAIALFAAILAIGLLREIPLGEIAMLAISQVVGMIPEGLPVAMTIGLAVGVQRMARRGAIVRRPAAVEALGCTTVICSDKTGTLTRNEMTVTALCLGDGREIAVTGAGYTPEGSFLEAGQAVLPDADPALRALLEAGVLCNDAQLVAPHATGSHWRAIGDPTEAALLTLAVKAGVVAPELRARFPRRAELPFDPAAKLMATQHASPAGSKVLLKGAPEVVLDLCARCAGVAATRRSTSRRAARRLPQWSAWPRARFACSRSRASRTPRSMVAPDSPAFQNRAVLLGLVGQIDPPRPEAADAVARCRAAGIQPVMVTGDHVATGMAVARLLGIAGDGDLAIDGAELERMSDAELARRIERVSVFARVHPAQKLRIVDAYQSRGEVVAMTGDGVNDAPALVRADVGVAMGITGTDVAKEAAKIVITRRRLRHDRLRGRGGARRLSQHQEGDPAAVRDVAGRGDRAARRDAARLSAAVRRGADPLEQPRDGGRDHRQPDHGASPRATRCSAHPSQRSEPLLTRALLRRMGCMTPAIVISTLGWFAARIAAGVPLRPGADRRPSRCWSSASGSTSSTAAPRRGRLSIGGCSETPGCSGVSWSEICSRWR